MTLRYNFSAGPSPLPAAVLEQVRADLPEWAGQGTSIMEISHRSPAFDEVVNSSNQNLRELLQLSDEYEILWVQGGASSQFSLVPMNLAATGNAGYIVTGSWSSKAFEAAKYHLNAHEVASSGPDFTKLAAQADWQLPSELDYLHITSNETIHGVQYHQAIEHTEIPLVIDASSDFLSRPLVFNDFDLMYAGAQKNLGPAGITIVIVKKSLLARSSDQLPPMFNYQFLAKKRSLYNTPPVFAWYVCSLVLDWLKEQGGLEAIAERNRKKALTLYNEIGRDDFYQNPVDIAARSLMNVPIRIHQESLEPIFLTQAEEAGFIGLKGHRSVGGLRASLYNAVTLEQTQALVDFMRDFRQQHG